MRIIAEIKMNRRNDMSVRVPSFSSQGMISKNLDEILSHMAFNMNRAF